MQKYLNSELFSNHQVEVLNKLRSRNIDVKSNFKTKYTFNNVEYLECKMDGCYEVEDQKHLLTCKPLLKKLDKKYHNTKITYNDIFSNVKKQKRVTDFYILLLDTRSSLLKNQN